MVFAQFYLGRLSQTSYLIGWEGVAAVIDPQRDVDLYIQAAAEHALKIQHVIETHLHADFLLSGHQEPAKRTSVRIYLGGGSGAKFPHRSVRDDDEISFGRSGLRFREAPGHTPGSIRVAMIDPVAPTDVPKLLGEGLNRLNTGPTGEFCSGHISGYGFEDVTNVLGGFDAWKAASPEPAIN